MHTLWWLPQVADWREKLKTAHDWDELVQLANAQLDPVQTLQLDRRLQALGNDIPQGCQQPPIRLAILSSFTVDPLLPGLRVAALRRGFWMQTYAGDFGQYRQELLDGKSGLHRFQPNVVLFAFDAPHLLSTGPGHEAGDVEASVQSVIDSLKLFWRQAQEHFSCQVIQQAILPTPLPVMGGNEHRLTGARRRQVAELNYRMRAAAEGARVEILSVDDLAMRLGLDNLHDPVLWHRAKQEITPAAAPYYGDLCMRLVAARRGRSGKCLVLDLDNTLWGGVIGDDGLEGIVLGQGTALGEAYVHFQNYVRDLTHRGIILAVCSKNDEANAISPFDKHPEMILKRDDIACFVANWQDKASNLRHIAQQLNIGLDALVFADDNPFERNIVRRELPMVSVPELPEDPALYARCLSDAGYFEALEITAEDRERVKLYRADQAREVARQQSTDLAGYLGSLDMKLVWRHFDRLGIQRIVQLVNKTNQFNLMTRRYTEAEIAAILEYPQALGLQIRLTDKFGDHGIIAIIIGRMTPTREMEIETWLMSCRVLGRGVEEACSDLLVQQARKMGATALVGRYKPTAKNGMVAEHYAKLGYAPTGSRDNGETGWRLDLNSDYQPRETPIETVEGS